MERIRRRSFLVACGVGTVGAAWSGKVDGSQGEVTSKPLATAGRTEGRRRSASGREDGRFAGTMGFLHAYLENMRPKPAFDPRTKARDFPAWREAVRQKVRELMYFPNPSRKPSPTHLWTFQRNGYVLQKWEAYPEPFSVVPFLVLVPDSASESTPAPAVMCFPGSPSSKESLAAEGELNGDRPGNPHWSENRMALFYVRKGIVAVAVDNPGTGGGPAIRTTRTGKNSRLTAFGPAGTSRASPPFKNCACCSGSRSNRTLTPPGLPRAVTRWVPSLPSCSACSIRRSGRW